MTDPEQLLIDRQQQAILEEALELVNPRYVAALRMRYGFDGDPMTLEATSQVLGVTRERVRQMTVQAERKLLSILIYGPFDDDEGMKRRALKKRREWVVEDNKRRLEEDRQCQLRREQRAAEDLATQQIWQEEMRRRAEQQQRDYAALLADRRHRREQEIDVVQRYWQAVYDNTPGDIPLSALFARPRTVWDL